MKLVTIEALMAKLTFWGMSPFVASISLSAFNLADTTPTRFPFWSSSGPPEFPGLHRRRNLKVAAVLADPDQRRHVAEREIPRPCENVGERKPESLDGLSEPDRSPEGSDFLGGQPSAKKSQIVPDVARDDLGAAVAPWSVVTWIAAQFSTTWAFVTTAPSGGDEEARTRRTLRVRALA